MIIFMYKTYTLLVFLIIFIEARNVNKIISRKKRYLTFPEGASLSVGICMTAQTGITPGEIFTEAINWAISYELPNTTKPFEEYLDLPIKLMQRRHRRDLYFKMESIMTSMGYNGKSCILRALCEASQGLKFAQDDLLNHILHIIFKYPWKFSKKNQYNLREEGDDHKSYVEASRDQDNAKSSQQCFEIFRECPFSLIDMARGFYSWFPK